MQSEQMLQLAVKYATRARKRLLADRLTDLAEALLKERAEEAEEEEEPDSLMLLDSQASNRSFASRYDGLDATPPVLDVEDNPILQAKQRRSSVVSAEPNNKTIRPLSQGKKNPFKKAPEPAASSVSPTPRGLAIFDQPPPTAKTTLSAASGRTQASKENKPKGTKQPTLFSSLAKSKAPPASAASPVPDSEPEQPTPTPPPASTKSGFQLWLEQNRAQLQADHPEVTNEGELVRLAAQTFKSLPEDERQVNFRSIAALFLLFSRLNL